MFDICRQVNRIKTWPSISANEKDPLPASILVLYLIQRQSYFTAQKLFLYSNWFITIIWYMIIQAQRFFKNFFFFFLVSTLSIPLCLCCSVQKIPSSLSHQLRRSLSNLRESFFSISKSLFSLSQKRPLKHITPNPMPGFLWSNSAVTTVVPAEQSWLHMDVSGYRAYLILLLLKRLDMISQWFW